MKSESENWPLFLKQQALLEQADASYKQLFNAMQRKEAKSRELAKRLEEVEAQYRDLYGRYVDAKAQLEGLKQQQYHGDSETVKELLARQKELSLSLERSTEKNALQEGLLSELRARLGAVGVPQVGNAQKNYSDQSTNSEALGLRAQLETLRISIGQKEAELGAERAQRERAENALRETQALCSELRTRLVAQEETLRDATDKASKEERRAQELVLKYERPDLFAQRLDVCAEVGALQKEGLFGLQKLLDFRMEQIGIQSYRMTVYQIKEFLMQLYDTQPIIKATAACVAKIEKAEAGLRRIREEKDFAHREEVLARSLYAEREKILAGMRAQKYLELQQPRDESPCDLQETQRLLNLRPEEAAQKPPKPTRKSARQDTVELLLSQARPEASLRQSVENAGTIALESVIQARSDMGKPNDDSLDAMWPDARPLASGVALPLQAKVLKAQLSSGQSFSKEIQRKAESLAEKQSQEDAGLRDLVARRAFDSKAAVAEEMEEQQRFRARRANAHRDATQDLIKELLRQQEDAACFARESYGKSIRDASAFQHPTLYVRQDFSLPPMQPEDAGRAAEYSAAKEGVVFELGARMEGQESEWKKRAVETLEKRNALSQAAEASKPAGQQNASSTAAQKQQRLIAQMRQTKLLNAQSRQPRSPKKQAYSLQSPQRKTAATAEMALIAPSAPPSGAGKRATSRPAVQKTVIHPNDALIVELLQQKNRRSASGAASAKKAHDKAQSPPRKQRQSSGLNGMDLAADHSIIAARQAIEPYKQALAEPGGTQEDTFVQVPYVQQEKQIDVDSPKPVISAQPDACQSQPDHEIMWTEALQSVACPKDEKLSDWVTAVGVQAEIEQKAQKQDVELEAQTVVLEVQEQPIQKLDTSTSHAQVPAAETTILIESPLLPEISPQPQTMLCSPQPEPQVMRPAQTSEVQPVCELPTIIPVQETRAGLQESVMPKEERNAMEGSAMQNKPELGQSAKQQVPQRPREAERPPASNSNQILKESPGASQSKPDALQVHKHATPTQKAQPQSSEPKSGGTHISQQKSTNQEAVQQSQDEEVEEEFEYVYEECSESQ